MRLERLERLGLNSPGDLSKRRLGKVNRLEREVLGREDSLELPLRS